MTKELGTTLQDIEAKAELKQEALDALDAIGSRMCILDGIYAWNNEFDTIRKYIKEN